MRATLVYGAGHVRIEEVPARGCRSRPVPWCGCCARPSAAATCGRTGRCRPPSTAGAWAMSSSARSRTFGGALAIAVYGALLADLGFLDGLRTSLLIAGLLLLATTLASLILRPTPQQ